VNNIVGKFVVSERGLAKVVGIDGEKYTIEYFISPWKRERISVELGSATPERLYQQTRVYVELNDRWRMGRIILAHDQVGGTYSYDIQFPNQQVLRGFSEDNIYCRCWVDHDDPTETLALGGMETQFFHDRRQQFTKTILQQRAACRGFVGILSSKIELVPHQLDVVSRILEDPLQRYLLADEVGMGKTIEAGMIIRQFLLSFSQDNVLVVTPDTLVKQWHQELESKFMVSEFSDRVNVCSSSEMEKYVTKPISLLVVDEAHHLVSLDIPDVLQQLASSSPRLLLLSATPSLGQTDVLLRLLKLLDPDCYDGVNFESFAVRVENREQFGIFLRGLRSDANPIVLRQRLKQLSQLFSSDQDALQLGDRVSVALEQGNIDELRRSIHSLRSHIADVHRIHQRLIRTRRRDAADWVFRPRGPAINNQGEPDLNHVSLIRVEDTRNETVFDLFEQWRQEISNCYSDINPKRRELANWVVVLFEAMGCGLDCMLDTIKHVPTHFLDSEWRTAFKEALDQANIGTSRANQIADELKRYLDALKHIHPNKNPQVVVFGSDLKDLNACASALGILIGNEIVLRAWDINNANEDIALSFESSQIAQVLFCSKEEEEGLNLHFTNAIVHLDCPFSPSRIEQRIGRLDRFGRIQDRIEHRIVVPSVNTEFSLWEAWFDLLANAFYIFNESVADVQFSLEEISNQLSDLLLEQGAQGIRGATEYVQKAIKKERDHLDNQYALDQVLQEDSTGELFKALDQLEDDEEVIADATAAWLKDVLGLACRGDHHRIFRFDWDPNRTLLPLLPWAKWLQPGLKGSHTFVRRHALHDQQNLPQLLRLGSCLYRSVQLEYQWDDRGTAFATWRQILNHDQEEWIAFKLCYIIEIRLPENLNEDEENSLRARLDAYLPPSCEVLYVDAALNLITDETLIEQLASPYSQANDKSWKDFNLGSRQEALFGLIDSLHFEKLCHSIRDTSEQRLREQSSFQSMVKEVYERGLSDIEHRNRRLTQRLSNIIRSGEIEDSGLSREIELNKKILETLSNPIVRLDAIGVIVLSSRSPEDFMLGKSL
jgi:ATP-dependent helicase HepA